LCAKFYQDSDAVFIWVSLAQREHAQPGVPGDHRDNAPDPSTGSGTAGGTAVLGDGVRVFKQFAWLEVGSGKAMLSRSAHQPRSAGVLRDG